MPSWTQDGIASAAVPTGDGGVMATRERVSDLTDEEMAASTDEQIAWYGWLDNPDWFERRDFRAFYAYRNTPLIVEYFEQIGRLKRALYPSKRERGIIAVEFDHWFDDGAYTDRSVWHLYQQALATCRVVKDQ